MRANGNGGNHRWDWRTVPRLLSAGGRSLGEHWMLATFSLVAAFALWFVIQDVENPRVTGFVPPESDAPAIVVQPLNVPNGYVVATPDPVRVKVEARKEDLPDLSPSDFEATIDLKDEPSGTQVLVPVDVRSKRSGVRVTSVTPSRVSVTIVKAEVKSMNVNVHRIGSLPPNYIEGQTSPPVVDPATVTVSGLPNLVDSVSTVDLDVDMSQVHSNSPIEGALVARTANGTPVTVSLSATRATVRFSITPQFEQRTVSPTPNITGQPAPGYHITNILVDPTTVTITGQPNDVNKAVGLERLDVSGATTDVNAIRKVSVPQNVSVDHQTVNVTVTIKPIECGIQGAAASACGAQTFVVAPSIGAPPSGLALDPSTHLSVQVSVYGPLDLLNTLKVSDIKASVSLSGAKEGIASYPVTVSVPANLTAVQPDAVTITLMVAP